MLWQVGFPTTDENLTRESISTSGRCNCRVEERQHDNSLDIDAAMERQVAFFSLPNELFSLLLTDWLRWEEVVRCDSAMCSKADRTAWLALLSHGCIFRSVAIGGWNAQVVSRWLLLRCIRTYEIELNNIASSSYDKESMENWLSETSPFIESVKLERTPKYLLKCIKRFCNRLTAARMTFQQPNDDLCWEIVRNNPLVELHIDSVPGGEDILIPHELSLPLLRKLSVDAERILNSEIFWLLEKLPLLQRLRIVSPSQEYAVLSESCPNLLYLDLSNALPPQIGDIQQIASFLRLLKVGLRCLLLPRNHRLTPEVTQAIVGRHAHSLHCLGFPSAAKKTRFLSIIRMWIFWCTICHPYIPCKYHVLIWMPSNPSATRVSHICWWISALTILNSCMDCFGASALP